MCQKYAQALSRERKANALLAAEPSSKNLRGVNVSEEYATLRAIFLDSPAQVRPEMGTYEGFIGKLRQTRLYGGLSRDLRPRVAGEAHRGLCVRWADVDGADWG